MEANLGDVMLAGMATGLLTLEEVKKWQVLGDKILPDPEAHEKYNQYYALYRKLYVDLKEDMRTLSEIR